MRKAARRERTTVAVFGSGEVKYGAALDTGAQWERKLCLLESSPVPPIPWVWNGTFSKAAG
jgi:hypothetical protein